ncbi:hypothetical protein ACDA63_07155 [Uliginosibacterium sp. sgz301328]|uniref:phage baseplate plug family protein n=1 Tax=Uliginosibacterium sp. sgz301328 TaxID=3243764 RepID=UPI00359E73E4
MSTFEIPLTSQPQRFTITLSGVDYIVTVRYRDAQYGGWVVDIADAQQNPMVSGIPLVTGIDLLAQYKYMGFGGRLWAQTTDDPDAVPTFANLGTGSRVYWVTD